MRRGRTASFLTYRWADDALSRRPDDLIVEEPMSILLDRHLVTTTMRTPGNDFELAAGFAVTEGLLHGAEVLSVRYCATESAVESEFNTVNVETGGAAPRPEPRLGPTTSSCGLCGSSSLIDLQIRLDPLDVEPFDLAVLAAAPVSLRGQQPLFDTTGSVHAAVAFDRTGAPVAAREDIGRHNAVDKVIGRLAMDGRLPASDLALFVSGRASFEIIQKAWAGGFGAVVAVSAPSALAVDTARAAGLTLAGFARHGEMNVYSPV